MKKGLLASPVEGALYAFYGDERGNAYKTLYEKMGGVQSKQKRVICVLQRSVLESVHLLFLKKLQIRLVSSKQKWCYMIYTSS